MGKISTLRSYKINQLGNITIPTLISSAGNSQNYVFSTTDNIYFEAEIYLNSYDYSNPILSAMNTDEGIINEFMFFVAGVDQVGDRGIAAGSFVVYNGERGNSLSCYYTNSAIISLNTWTKVTAKRINGVWSLFINNTDCSVSRVNDFGVPNDQFGNENLFVYIGRSEGDGLNFDGQIRNIILGNKLINSKISVKRNNLGGGRLVLKEFTPDDFKNLSLWLKADAGVSSNTIAGVNSTTGKVGNCASFDGEEGGGAYNSNLYTNSFGVNVQNDFSLSVWIKPRSFSSVQHIIGDAFQNGLYIGADETDLTFNLYNGTVFGITAPTVTVNTWHHYVFIRSGNTLKLYADGSFIGNVDITGETFNNASNFSVGSGVLHEYFFNGDIDEMGVWSRAITVSEISTLYNSGNGTNYAGSPSSNMVSYWSLNETSGTRYDSHGSNHLTEYPTTTQAVVSWADQSGNGKDATPLGASPTITTINSNSFIHFNGVDQALFGPNVISALPCTIISVVRVASYFGADLWFQQNETLSLYADGDTFGWTAYNGEAFTSTDAPWPINTTQLATTIFNGGNSEHFHNGLAAGTGDSGYDAPYGNYYLSYYLPVNAYKNYDIAEIIIYNRAITTTERQQVEAYLKAKYAIY